MAKITLEAIRDVLRGIYDPTDREACRAMLSTFRDENGKPVNRPSLLQPKDYEEFMGLIKNLK